MDWFRLAALSILWGGSFLFVEVALDDLPPLTIVWARVALAALMLAPLALRPLWRPLGRPSRPMLVALVGMGLFNNVLPFTLFALAQGRLDAAVASFLNATTPLWTLVMAHLATQDERITGAKAGGLALGLTGVLVLGGGAGAGEGWAIGACLAAAASYGVAAVWGRRFRALGMSPLTTAFGQLSASTLLLLPLWLAVDRPWTLPAPPAGTLAAVAGLATLSTALAYLLYFRLLAGSGAVFASLVTFLIPVSAAGLGMVLLDQPVQPHQIAGFAIIAAGLLLLRQGGHHARP